MQEPVAEGQLDHHSLLTVLATVQPPLEQPQELDNPEQDNLPDGVEHEQLMQEPVANIDDKLEQLLQDVIEYNNGENNLSLAIHATGQTETGSHQLEELDTTGKCLFHLLILYLSM